MAKKYENIENIGKMISEGVISDLSKKIAGAEKAAFDVLKKLSDMDNAQAAKRLEEEQRAAQEKLAEEQALLAAREAAERAAKEAEEAEKAAKEAKKDAEKPVEQGKDIEAVQQPAAPARSAATEKAQPSTVQEKPAVGKIFVNNDRAPKGDRNAQRPQQGNVPRQGNNNNSRPQQGSARPQNQSSRPQGGAKFTAQAASSSAASKPANKNFGADKKKQTFEKTYVEKERRQPSKRALAKQQGPGIDDFDEDKSGYRKLRVKKDKKQQNAQAIKIEHAVVTTNEIPLKVLSEKLGITAVEITKKLFKEGVMKTVNESIDYDTAALIAAGMGIELEYKPEKTAEEILTEKQADTVEEIESLVPRAPVVTVMGHVDHGKTSLLDYIRKQNVTAGEAGGITQHIGAYSVSVNGKSITFIDTPGHEAFTAMRARGAQVTDIVILVVAADDGIMPQTVEAINHAKAANVSIIVAVNKMDKVGANPEKVKQDLTGYGLVPEEWGGDTPVCLISCKTGQGIEELLENVLLVAEMKELLANPEREARGAIIEAQLDKGKGPVATVLVQNGTLRTGDNIISGTITGRVRAMIDDKGRTVKEAGPSAAVYVLGFEEVPNAGDSMFAVSQELMKSVIEERKRKESDAMVKAASKISLDEVFGKIAEGNMKTLNLIIKGDVQGSVEAVKQSVVKLSNEEVQVKVIHSGAGAITESDVMLADSSNAIILGFNVRPDVKAKATAERSKVDVRTYRIIYDLLDDIEAALKGMLSPKYQEVYLGKCEVRQTFKITGVGNVAGCYVKEGKIVRGGKLRIYRDDVLVVEGNVQQLKRFKDDVKEVNYGYECGCSIEGFNDIQVGDIIECYLIEQIAVK
ncbi:MAG: translation initiation factor IF-2 [Candidatus Coproplasma sp.]